MVDDEMLDMMYKMLDEPELDGLCETYLEYAQQAVVSRMWPFDAGKTFDDVPESIRPRTVQIAVYMLNKRGVEGETRHVENGTTHEWSAAGIPASFFEGIVPRVGVV